jgi:hypothetical protein
MHNKRPIELCDSFTAWSDLRNQHLMENRDGMVKWSSGTESFSDWWATWVARHGKASSPTRMEYVNEIDCEM